MARSQIDYMGMFRKRAPSRVYNVSHVPHDVWLGIWRLLSFDDRRTVTRICKAWRKTALRTGGMWTELDFFTTLHARGCGCAYCEPRQGPGPTPVGWSGYRGVHWMRSNMRFASGALSLSGEQLLDITIEIMPYLSRRDELEALARSLVPHAARIRSLSIKSADLSGYAQFMACFSSFAKLQTFTATLLENEQDQYDSADLMPPTLELPLLQRIYVDRNYDWPPGDVSYPELRHVSIAPRYNAADHVLRALACCPQRETFRLDLHAYVYHDSVQPTSPDRTDEIEELASLLRSVELLGLQEASADWALSTLARQTIPTLSLEYASPDDVVTDDDTLAELPGELALRLAWRGDWPNWVEDAIIVFEMENDSGHSRRLAVHRCDLPAEYATQVLGTVGEALAREKRTVSLVTADYLFWSSMSDLGQQVDIHTLQIVLHPGDIAEAARPTGPTSDDEDSGHHVSVLTLVYGSGPLVLPVRAITHIVRNVLTWTGLPLDVLSIDSRISIPDAHKMSKLAAVARSVVVRPCYVPDVVFPSPLPDPPADDDAKSQYTNSEDNASDTDDDNAPSMFDAW